MIAKIKKASRLFVGLSTFGTFGNLGNFGNS